MILGRALIRSTAAPLPLTARAAPDPPFSPQHKADIAPVKAYLNGLKSLKAHFIHVAQDGSISEGTAWMQRPRRHPGGR